jgi:hypothetical protein
MKKFGSLALLAGLGMFATGCGHHDFEGERAAHDSQRSADQAALDAARAHAADHPGQVVVEPGPRVIIPTTTIEVQNDHRPVLLPIARREPIDARDLGAEAREDAADAAGLAAKDAAEQLLRSR